MNVYLSTYTVVVCLGYSTTRVYSTVIELFVNKRIECIDYDGLDSSKCGMIFICIP